MARLIANFLLWLSGWKVKKDYPPEATRCVMIAAPHTTNWDAYFVKLATISLGIPMKIAIKDNWTKGLIGFIMRPMGALGIDRSPKNGSDRMSQVDLMADLFKTNDSIALAIAPEGTRKRREKWKRGFYWVAKKADVPITFGYLDYEKKEAGVGPEVLWPSDDIDKDFKKINDFYRDIKAKYPEKYSLDLRFEKVQETKQTG